MIKKALFFFITFVLLSCESKEPWELLIDENISKINGDIRVTEIDLDLFESTHVEPDLMISTDTSVIIGMPRDLFVLNDSLYLLDQSQNSVFTIDKAGTVTRKIDKTGRGPGESTRATSMANHGEFIYMYDHGNSRLQILDDEFSEVAYITASPNPFVRSVTAAGSLLYFTDALSQRGGDRHLIKQYSIYPEPEKQGELVPRLLPEGVQPIVINNVSFHANSEGYLAAGYDALPKLFLYNPEGKLIHSIEFSGSPVELLNEYNEQNRRIDQSNPGGQIGLAPFIYSILIDDQMNIYMVALGRRVFMFSLQDNVYQLTGSRTVEHPDGGGAGIRPIVYEDRMFIVYENYPDILVYNLAGLFSD